MTTNAHPRGFTLIEMAVVVVVIGIALSLGLKVASSLMRTTQLTETRTNIDIVKRAMVIFLGTEGRLPCPAGSEDGVERPTCNGTNAFGIVPWQDLGIRSDHALDGWGNFLSYHVAVAWTNQANFDINLRKDPSPPNFLSVQERLSDGTLTDNDTFKSIPLVIISHGKNGYGSRTRQYTQNDDTAAGADEDENLDADIEYIRRQSTTVTTATGGAFDDIVEYMKIDDLLGTLFNEGWFRECESYCTTPAPGCTTPAAPPNTIPIGAQGITCL